MTVQTKNGYTMIANELLDALCKIRISGEEMQIFNFILRKTYGYKKKQDKIALSQFNEGTGIPKPHISRAIKKLLEKNMIAKNGNKYAVNKSYKEWKPLPKKVKVIAKIGKTIAKNGNDLLPKMDDTKESKRNFTKEISTNVDTAKQHGKAEINDLLAYLKQKTGLTVLDKTIEKNRQYAQLCLNKYGFEKTKLVIDASQLHKYWKTKVTNFMAIYYDANAIVLAAREGVKSVDATKILHSQNRQGGNIIDPRRISGNQGSIITGVESSMVRGQNDLNSPHQIDRGKD